MKIKKILKITAITIFSVGICFFLVLFVSFYIYFAQSKEVVEIAKRGFTPGTKEYETYKKWNAQFEEYYKYRNQAKKYIEKKDYDLAIAEYKKILKKDYDEWMTHKSLLSVYEQAGYYKLALEEITLMKGFKPDNIKIQTDLNNREKQIENLMTTSEGNLKKWDETTDQYCSYIEKAHNYIIENNRDAAIKEYIDALKLNYNEEIIHNYLLGIYEKAGHYNLAIEEINWLLAQGPRQQVVEELKNRKTEIEGRIKEGSKIVNVINGVTEKDYVLKEMGDPDEILELDDGQTKWVYKNYITLETVIPNFAKSQDFIITFDKNDIVLDNYIGIHRTESEISDLTPPEFKDNGFGP